MGKPGQCDRKLQSKDTGRYFEDLVTRRFAFLTDGPVGHGSSHDAPECTEPPRRSTNASPVTVNGFERSGSAKPLVRETYGEAAAFGRYGCVGGTEREK